MLQSRHFFGLIRLRTSEVPEPSPAPGKMSGTVSREKMTAPAPDSKIFHFRSEKFNYYYKSFLDHIEIEITPCLHIPRARLVFFVFPKRSSLSWCRQKKQLRLSAPTYNKIGSGSGIKLAAPGRSGSATLQRRENYMN